ncbi:MAG: 4-(cytidine 5'-diphospho)-2-C-methyl-D-erythritol kinase [Candidatus Pelagibacter sp.]
MKFVKIKSYAKINISLGILTKLKSKLHKIESLFSFIDLHDEIFIKKIINKNHKIVFYGKFSKGITKNNTISNLLKIIEKKISGQKYLIKINKKIPQKSGFGGGSMNASSLLKFLIKNKKLKLSSKEIRKISSKVGSDVVIGMQNKASILYGNGYLKDLNNRINLYTILVRPNFGCSTKSIYNNIKFFSKPIFKINKRRSINYKFLSNLRNDLEEPAFRKHPVLKKIKIFMEKVDKILFVNMTGSGSSIVGYFMTKKTALNAIKN